MGLTKTALRRPVSCILIVLALCVFGISSVFGFKQQLLPDMEIPMLIVYTVYPGADPETVDELVSKVVEDAGSTLTGVSSVISQSSENVSMVVFQYDYGVDLDECYSSLRTALDTAAMTLPDSAATPRVIEMNINSVASLQISCTEKGDVDLLKVVEESVVPKLEKVAGVAQVEVSGGTEEYIKVELDEMLMSQYGLTMNSLAQIMAASNFNYPAGTVVQGSQEISVNTIQESNTVQAIRDLPIMTSKGALITVGDIANVTMASKDAESISRLNGVDDISIGIQPKSSYGTVNVCKAVKKALKEIEQENPSVDFTITYDASTSITDSLKSVGETLLVGVLLSMLVLFLFFGDLRASLIVGSAMPISLLATLILMSLMGFSLNIVTMGSLVIAIGMMVDSSIVVIESCFRMREKKPDIKEAAFEGTKVVAGSILASTITTVVVYLPVAFTQGMVGQVFEQLSFTIVFAMTASLIAAMTLIPLFYSIFKPEEKTEIPMNRFLKKVTVGYKKALHKMLNRRVLVLFIAVLMTAVSVLAAVSMDKELMPMSDEGVVNVSAQFRSGTSLEYMDEAMKTWTEIAEAEPDVQNYSLSISNSSATLAATLKKDREKTTMEIVDEWNKLAADSVGMSVTASSGGSSIMSMMNTGMYEVDLQGDDMEQLRSVASDLEGKFREVDGVLKVTNSGTGENIRARVDVDPLLAMQVGMTPIQVASSIKYAMDGMTALTVTKEGSEYDVILEYPKGSYDDVNSLLDMNLITAAGTMVPLRDIADVVYEEALDQVYKQDGSYRISLTCITPADSYFAVQKSVNEVVDNYAFPEGTGTADSMMSTMMTDEFSTLYRGILIAAFLVFLVMAMQFESPRFSFMVMFCIPFALVGSFLLMYILGTTLSMVSLMGFLMLMGIVVNNGILYVDTVNQMKQEMPLNEALVETGAVRMRPILMTSLTTILSMFPLALGLGANGAMMQGMAVVIIGGLVASTALTLIMMPTIYLTIDKEARKERREQRAAKRAAKA